MIFNATVLSEELPSVLIYELTVVSTVHDY